MKVYLSRINEDWIVDRLRKEWYKYNKSISTNYPRKSNIVWIISPWLWKKESKNILQNKTVICSIFHFKDSDFETDGINEFNKRDQYVDFYHVISLKTKKELETLTDKQIFYIPFWTNQNLWFPINEKKELRLKYEIPIESYVVGSFQRDTEGKDLKSPKLIKGPDRFIEIVKEIKSKQNNLLVLLTGKRRQYVINELKKLKINYIYKEMVNEKILNELYNCLDLYVVASRKEGGPQAIVECGMSKTPIISTDVGFASSILSSESIFDMKNYQYAKPNVDIAYQNSLKLSIPKGFKEFINLFESFGLK